MPKSSTPSSTSRAHLTPAARSSGRVVIVTGAASGIGLALTRRLLARGDTVIAADRNEVGLAALVAEAEGMQGRALAQACDVTDAASVQATVDRAVREFGRLDVMVNNAGVGLGGALEEMTPEHWDAVIDVNLRGVAYGATAAYKVMVEQGDGLIVNVASLSGVIPSPFLTPYSTTKHAVVGLSQSLRAEAAGTGVSVVCVCPGFTETPILDSANLDGLPATKMGTHARRYAEGTPGGIYRVEELARDIERGMDHAQPMVVAPFTARIMWRVQRYVPALMMREASRVAQRTRHAFGGSAPTDRPVRSSETANP